ncbi:isochorismatase family protein [Nocardia asiatica]|uniref:isochorismatase family protein n=1 Tax=Nocardia asiatica TaxID=209252 RepID=UPI003EE2F6A9
MRRRPSSGPIPPAPRSFRRWRRSRRKCSTTRSSPASRAANCRSGWRIRASKQLFVTGVATNLTVEQTARHGTDLGFTVHPVADCVAAATEEAHEAALANLELVTAGRVSAAEALERLQSARA